MLTQLRNRRILSWALYDWASSAFATTVMAGFYPVFFKQYWAKELPATTSSFWFGLGTTVAGIIALLMAPILGALALRVGKIRPLKIVTLFGCLATAMLFAIPSGAWPLALLVFIIASISFSSSYVFYDGLLVDIVPIEQRHKVSALGFSLGYLGGGILFALNVFMVAKPAFFGLADTATAVRYSLLMSGVWWGVFALPLFIMVKEQKSAASTAAPLATTIVQLCRSAVTTMKAIRHQRGLLLFLVAYWLYIDGVDTIMRMAVDYGLAIGLQSGDLTKALLLTQFIGLPATLAFGFIAHRCGAWRGILIGLVIYLLVSIWAYFIKSAWEFYLLAIVVGLVQGGVQSLSRSHFAHLIPPTDNAGYFGFYNMFGKFAALFGPILMGATAYLTGNPRASTFVVLVLFGLGIILLIFSRAGSATTTTPQ